MSSSVLAPVVAVCVSGILLFGLVPNVGWAAAGLVTCSVALAFALRIFGLRASMEMSIVAVTLALATALVLRGVSRATDLQSKQAEQKQET